MEGGCNGYEAGKNVSLMQIAETQLLPKKIRMMACLMLFKELSGNEVIENRIVTRRCHGEE